MALTNEAKNKIVKKKVKGLAMMSDKTHRHKMPVSDSEMSTMIKKEGETELKKKGKK